jgi:ferredoxin-NADP reductase
MRELSIQFIQPAGFKFQAGQFIMMQVPDPEKGKPTQRAYSLASDDRTP